MAHLPFDYAIQTLYAARRPLTTQRRTEGLNEVEQKALESLDAALDVLEMMEHFRVSRPEKDRRS